MFEAVTNSVRAMSKSPPEHLNHFAKTIEEASRDLDKVSRQVEQQISRFTYHTHATQLRLGQWNHAYDRKEIFYQDEFVYPHKGCVVINPIYNRLGRAVSLIDQSACSETGTAIYKNDKTQAIVGNAELLSNDGLNYFLTNTFDFQNDFESILSEVLKGKLKSKLTKEILKPAYQSSLVPEHFPPKIQEPSKKDFKIEGDNFLSSVGNWFGKNENIKLYNNAITKYDKYTEKWEAIKARYDQLVGLLEQEWQNYTKASEHWLSIENKNEENYKIHQASHAQYVNAVRKSIDFVIDKYKNEIDNTQAVEAFFELVYRLSPQPKIFPRNITIDFDSDTKILVCSVELPNFNYLPLHKEVSGKIRPLNQSEKKNAFEYGVFATWLRVAYEIAKADMGERVTKICINGWIKYIDQSDGITKTSTILSSLADINEYRKMNVGRVDPKVAFRSLGGRASPQPDQYTAITPVLRLNREDGRLRESEFSANNMESNTNLASMDWEEFEHLVRDLFSKEFSGETAEVKVTQASRDGGVDAIAYDDDPIRGGKFLIQAKRYTNTVDISAVRELYAVVIDEGANRGILVTTSNYGPDAYEYVKDKPITLINGRELLGLLEKHGNFFRIDLIDAKKNNR